MMQVIAGRADLIPEPYVSAISTLTDRVPPVSSEAVEREIVAAYGKPARELFEEWNPVPVAAASIGQVHKAVYHGREVAVKVLRPGVERLVADDIVASRRIIAWAGKLFDNPHITGLRAVIDEFARRINDEMDFRCEAEYAIEIRHNFANVPNIVVPEIVEGMVRQRVLVMEYMHGTKLDALGPKIASGSVDPRKLVSTVMEMYVQMMMIDGLFHADPHAGNLLVRDDGALILLDFGLVVRVPKEIRLALVRTIFAAIRRDPEGVTDGFFALGVVTPGTSRDVVLRLVQTLLMGAFEKTTTQERMAMMNEVHAQLLADRVLTTLYDFPVMLPPDLVYFARTAALIEGFGVRYDERFNALEFAAPIAIRLRHRILMSLGVNTRPEPRDIADAMRSAWRKAGMIIFQAGKELAGLASDVVMSLTSGLSESADPFATPVSSSTYTSPPSLDRTRARFSTLKSSAGATTAAEN
jgi:predicted unusual protein kinase regulating ubiquinone biosynthesis (AarF/ABC1/UbiB family)